MTNVTVRRDEEGNVHAHWVSSVSFHPSVCGDPPSFYSLINECVENFTTQLQAEIAPDFEGFPGNHRVKRVSAPSGLARPTRSIAAMTAGSLTGVDGTAGPHRGSAVATNGLHQQLVLTRLKGG